MTALTMSNANGWLPGSTPWAPDAPRIPLGEVVVAWRWWSWRGAAVRANRLTQATLAHVATMVSQPRGAASRDRPLVANTDAIEIRFQRDIVAQLDAAYNFARFLSRDADAAQDIVQEAFLRAYRGFDGYQGGDPRAWIFAIIRNCYHDLLLERRRKARLEVETSSGPDDEGRAIEHVASEEDDPETALLRRSDAGQVRAVLADLPRPLREILVLREIEGLSYRQIAEIAGLPIGTVMSRLARARAQFQAAWRRDAGAQEPTS
jgi:RNA polymerase sigma factor (sigma-70 family)